MSLTTRGTVDELIAFYSQPTKCDSWLAEEKPRDQLWERRLRFSLVSNSLDPFYVASGLGSLKPAGLYQCCRALKAILCVNLYDTILVAARKSPK